MRLFGAWRRLLSDRSGTLALSVALVAPVLIALSGAAIDYTRMNKSRARLQTAADSAALAGASALHIANTTPTAAASVSEAQARAAAGSIDGLVVNTSVTTNSVRVNLAANVPTSIMKMFGTAAVHIEARAQANILGSTPTCLVVLDPASKDTFDIDQATVSAPGCAVYSNSTASDAISLDKSASLATNLTCSSGGAIAKGGATFSPPAVTDCPARLDPLTDRAQPQVGPCTATNLSITTTTTLIPGTYCGGINIQKDAYVTLQAGTYVIKDGKLKTNGNAAISGSGVTLYLTGSGAVLDIGGQSSLDLTAPAFGPLAGILVFEDRAAKIGQKHNLHSRNAPNLLGTVYLSRGILEIGAKGGYATASAGMAQSSAWTIIVARQLSINDKISLVLNTNYDATAVKPPPGAVPNAQISLVE